MRRLVPPQKTSRNQISQHIPDCLLWLSVRSGKIFFFFFALFLTPFLATTKPLTLGTASGAKRAVNSTGSVPLFPHRNCSLFVTYIPSYKSTDLSALKNVKTLGSLISITDKIASSTFVAGISVNSVLKNFTFISPNFFYGCSTSALTTVTTTPITSFKLPIGFPTIFGLQISSASTTTTLRIIMNSTFVGAINFTCPSTIPSTISANLQAGAATRSGTAQTAAFGVYTNVKLFSAIVSSP
jgi:hypothetical protein